jgi:hypothetical protein
LLKGHCFSLSLSFPGLPLLFLVWALPFSYLIPVLWP